MATYESVVSVLLLASALAAGNAREEPGLDASRRSGMNQTVPVVSLREPIRTAPTTEGYDVAFGKGEFELAPPHYEEGSLWSDASPFNSPFEFKRQTDFEVGDTILVEIKENFQSRDDLRYQNKTESEVNFDLSNLWSVELDRQVFGRIDGAIDYPKTKITGQDDYEGESRGQQRSVLTMKIACTVKKVLPDGRLLVEGRDSRIIGRDKKIFLMSGIVDPDDVDPETRMVSSDRVADSQFRWEGNGPGQNVMKPGIIHRFLDFIPLF